MSRYHDQCATAPGLLIFGEILSLTLAELMNAIKSNILIFSASLCALNTPVVVIGISKITTRGSKLPDDEKSVRMKKSKNMERTPK